MVKKGFEPVITFRRTVWPPGWHRFNLDTVRGGVLPPHWTTHHPHRVNVPAGSRGRAFDSSSCVTGDTRVREDAWLGAQSSSSSSGPPVRSAWRASCLVGRTGVSGGAGKSAMRCSAALVIRSLLWV